MEALPKRNGTSMTLAPPSTQRRTAGLSRARIAVGVLFFTNGAIFANLLPRYPQIKADLDLSNTAFGLGVAAYPLGALVAGLAAGVLIRRFRSSRVAVVTTLLTALGVFFAGTAPTWALLAGFLFLAGAMDAITDVAQNSHGLRVQKLYRRSIINSLHAVWCVGAVLGGALGAAAAGLSVSVGLHLAVSGAVFAALALGSYRFFLPGPEPTGTGPADPQRTDPQRTDPEPDEPVHNPEAAPKPGARRSSKYAVLFALVLIAASAALVEDAGSSWSAVYLSGSLGATAFVAGFGFIALQGMQFVGRILGDRMVDRFGERTIAQAGGILLFLGMGTALALPSLPGTIIGFGCAGLGVATLIPAAMHAADRLPGLKPGSGLTIVSWLLRLGFLLSAPLVGAIADLSSVRYGLLIVPAAGLVVLAFSPVLNRRSAR